LKTSIQKLQAKHAGSKTNEEQEEKKNGQGFKEDNGKGKNKHLETRKHRNNNPSLSKKKNEAKKQTRRPERISIIRNKTLEKDFYRSFKQYTHGSSKQ